jgi:hypothetical protein
VNTLKRYGVIWVSDTTPITSPMKDGYWTPWYLAQDRIAELEEIAKAVAHIGIDFGYGVYEIETKHIESARQYFLAKGGAE